MTVNHERRDKMTAKNVTIEAMQMAMAAVNERYKGNLDFQYLEAKGKHLEFTLRTKSSYGPGSRLGFTGRHMPKACWHAHGHFFESVFKVAPDAVIVSRGGPGSVITKDQGNWRDCNIGSQMQPMMFSEACECDRRF